MPRLEALKLRDQSMVAAYPHMKPASAQNWLDGLRKAARRVSHAADALFSLNGKPVTVRGLRERLGRSLGGGFSGE